jgi:hypothetical protein
MRAGSLRAARGDYCSPFALRRSTTTQCHGGVFGRNDGDPEGCRAFAAQGMGQELFESPHSIELRRHKVLVVHDIGDVVERSCSRIRSWCTASRTCRR